GTAGTAAAHAVQYPFGALTHTPHGLGVATRLPYVMTYNRRVAGADSAIGGRALGLDPTGVEDDETIAEAASGEVSR
ncbi:iron-containing alcohol dehydrogenase, partial [Rhizobium ruizarguesonis]